MFVPYRSSLENHTRFQTKKNKVFRPKRRKNLTLWAAHTYMVYMAYIGGYPPRVYLQYYCDANSSQVNFI